MHKKINIILNYFKTPVERIKISKIVLNALKVFKTNKVIVELINKYLPTENYVTYKYFHNTLLLKRQKDLKKFYN